MRFSSLKAAANIPPKRFFGLKKLRIRLSRNGA
jgi:hypothetical protein